MLLKHFTVQPQAGFFMLFLKYTLKTQGDSRQGPSALDLPVWKSEVCRFSVFLSYLICSIIIIYLYAFVLVLFY